MPVAITSLMALAPKSSSLSAICQAALEATPQLRSVELAPNEDELRPARLAVTPRADDIALRQHVHSLEGKALVLAGKIQNALGPQHILALLCQKAADPGVESLLIKGAIPGPKGGLVLIRTTSKAVLS